MKVSRHNKALLFEQEFATLFFIVALGFLFHYLQFQPMFYFVTLCVGFILYFLMVKEEQIHITGIKHEYFEHTSSYLMIAQTAIALELFSLQFNWNFLFFISMIIAVIMYSVSLSRIVLFKFVFKDEHKKM